MSLSPLVPLLSRLPSYELSRPFVIGMYEGRTEAECLAVVGTNSDTTTVADFLRWKPPARIDSGERRDRRQGTHPINP